MKDEQKLMRVAAYCRLSKDDGTDSESASISTQKRILGDYIKQQKWHLVRYYVDDGYSGTNFERPEFKAMIADIEAGKIDCVITKDLSRLGRNYLDCGLYLEVFFPEHNIRYISVNDGVDTLHKAATDITPFRNILNEMYAADISTKIRSAYRARFNSGKFMAPSAPYGYRKDPNDHNHLLIDEEAAAVVRQIYALALEGKGVCRIRNYLNTLHILRPSAYQTAHGNADYERYFAGNDENRYIWSENGIRMILRNPVYAGHLVGYMRPTVSMKSKKRRSTLPEDWEIIPNTHEAIISQSDFDTVQRMITSRRRSAETGYNNVFAGIIKCADCGYHMSVSSAHRRKRPDIIDCVAYVCGNYDRYGTLTCSSHKLEARDLIDFVLADINRCAQMVLGDEKAVANLQRRLSNISVGEADALERERSKLSKRLSELDRLFSALYEDRVMERITPRNYELMSRKYEEEQLSAEARIRQIDEELSTKLPREDMIRDFIDAVRQYRGITELTPAIVNALIDKITVSERHVNENGEVEQHIKIYYKFIGAIDEPVVFVPTKRYSAQIEKVCVRCGETFMATGNSARFCPVCRPIARKEKQQECAARRTVKRRKYKKIHGTPGFTMKNCRCCGAEYKPKCGNSVYCPDCKALTPHQREVRHKELTTA